MYDHRIYLKVKVKSLAAEAKLIRAEEHKNPRHREGLSRHRRSVVRGEARHTLLAYGFLRGKTYQQMEQRVRDDVYPDFQRVWRMVEKYGVQWDLSDDYREYKERREEQEKRFWEWARAPLKN